MPATTPLSNGADAYVASLNAAIDLKAASKRLAHAIAQKNDVAAGEQIRIARMALARLVVVLVERGDAQP